MADISKIKLLNGDVYDVKDNSAVANITRDGTTFTATKRDGSTFTFTQQDNDTKNTAGSTDTSSKIFLIGATSQADNPQTYSDDEIFATNGVLSAKGFTAMRTLTAVTSGKGDLGASATPRYIPYLWYGSFDHDPVDGEIIIIKMPSAGNTAGIYLSINGNDTTKYHPIAIGTTTRLTTQYASGNMLMLIYQASQTVTTYPIAGANSASSSAAGIWRVLNYYDSNTNTLLRVYSSATDINVPLIGQSSANSTTASWSSYTSTYKDWYGAIPNDDAKRAKINLSTGALTVPGGITANLIGNVTGNADTATNVAWSGVTDKPSEFTPSSHTHGNITNAGAITATQSIANGDKIVIVDSSNSSKLTGTTIEFDGSTATKALTQKGTWETFNNYSLPLAANGTRGGIQIGYSETGNNYAVNLSGEKAYVTVPWTDTQVTAVSNHYTPAADTNEELTGTLSGTAGTYAKDTEYTVLTGVKAQRDAAGHVVGITYTAQKIKDTNNTYTVGNKALKIASDSGTATQAITVNESSSDRILTIKGDGTYLTGAVSGSSNAATVTISHKDPVAVDGSKLTASASGATAAWSIDVVKGITVNRDAKGHVTGISVTSGKIPANPNTDTLVKQTLMANTENVEYKLLTTTSASPTSGTADEAKYGANLAYNPSTNKLSTGNLKLTGTLEVTGQTTLNDNLNAQGITATNLQVNGATNFVQSPTAPTPASGDNSTKLATTEFVYNAFTVNDAMVFKGVVNANSDLPATHKQGWTYKIGTAGTYAGQTCEIGDTIYCITDGTSANNAHWVVVQNNIDILPIARGGTGATTAAGAFTNIVAPGGKMTGPLAWNDGTALPAITSPSYILAIESFANGGTTKYVTTANLATAIDSSHKWVRIDGDTMTGTLNIDRSDTTDSATLNLKSNRGTLWIGSEGTGDSTPIQGFWLHSTKENSADSGLWWNDDNYIAGISKFATDLLPSTKNARNLGSYDNSWANLYANGLHIISYVSRYKDIYFDMYASPNTRASILRYDTGNATNISSGQFSFYEYSPNTTADTTHSGHYERFYLPVVTAGLEADKGYAILTTKNPLFAISSTAAATAAKTASITGFQLVNGATAYIQFANTNTHANPTLNISSTGAKAIFDQHGTRITASYGHYLQAGKIYQMVYSADANDGEGAYIIVNNPHVLELYENRSVTTGLNKAAGYGGLGSMFHILATSKITDKTNNNKCSFDAHVLQMTWDNTTGNYDAQLALATAAQRMQFRTGTASTSAWQEVAHAPTALNASNEAVFNGVGSSTQPVYMNSSGVITAITGAIDNSTTGNAATATQLANTRTLWGQSFNGTADVSGAISNAGNITPTTTITSNIGSASLRWNYGYFRNLYLSNDENYTTSTSATNGITLSGIGGWIDLTSPDTSTTPHIDFKLNKSALDYQVRLESDSPGRITIKRDTTNVTTSKADPNKAAANVTYNNRSIDPVFQVTGIAHFSSAINAATYLFNNSAAGGDNTGYYLAANNVTSGRLYIATRGLASVSDGADPPTYTDTPGRAILQLGNAREGRPTIGVDDNAAGWLRLYGEGIHFHDIRPSTAVRHQVSYLPQYYTGTSSSSSTYYYGRLAAIYKGTAVGEDGFSDVGSISQPVYVTKEGIIKATDSFMRYYSISSYYNATSRSWKKVATLSVDALPKLTGGSSAWIILQFFNGTTYDTIPMGTLRALVYRKDTDTSGVTTDTAITLKLDWIDCNLEGNFENYKLVYTLTDNPTVEDSGNKDLTADLWVKVNKNYEAIICKELAEGKWSVNYPLGTFWTLSDSASATGTTVAKAAGFTTDPAAAGAPNAITSTYFIEKGAAGYLTYYSSNKTLAKTSFAHFNWKTGTTAEDGYEELVLGNSANSGTDNNAFGRLAMYSSGTKGTYIVPANNTTAWYTATLQAKTGTIALTSDITTAIQALDVSSVGNTNGSKYIAAISEADGKISATAVDVATTYSASGTTAISGTGVAAALGTLDVAAVGGGTGEYISQISETDGKISATKTTTSVSNAWEGGTDAGPKIKTTVNGITGTAVAIPHATNAVSGVVTTTTQTFAGEKTFANNVTISGTSTHTGAAAFNATGNSTHSKDTNAAVVVKGGVSVEKQISARTVRVDGTSTDNSNTTPGGVSLQYDSTLQVLNFVFS